MQIRNMLLSLEREDTPCATALIVMLTLPVAVATQDLQKGYVAYQRGDYATALLEWRLLAEQGSPLKVVHLLFPTRDEFSR